jgi:hypothetical protein
LTKEELSQLYYLKKEIAEIMRRLTELETFATSGTSRITDLPRGTEISDKVGKNASEIADLKAKLETTLQKRILAENKINEFIQNTTDSLVRLILTHRFINCYSWTKVAWKVGGNNTSDSLRKILMRFLNSS